MSIPGNDLSQPARPTKASKRSACIIASTESAMISRLTREACMPSWPMAIPSETAIDTNSKGKPPAARTPCFARWARRASGKLQGVTSFHVEATPTCGLSKSSSVMPTARSIAREGARRKPSVTSWLWILSERILSVIGFKLLGRTRASGDGRLQPPQVCAQRRHDPFYLARGAPARPGPLIDRVPGDIGRGAGPTRLRDGRGDVRLGAQPWRHRRARRQAP